MLISSHQNDYLKHEQPQPAVRSDQSKLPLTHFLQKQILCKLVTRHMLLIPDQNLTGYLLPYFN